MNKSLIGKEANSDLEKPGKPTIQIQESRLQIDLATELAKLDREFRDKQLTWINSLLLEDFERGFECLIERYRPYVYAVSRYFMVSEDIDDIVQVAFICAYKALKNYPSEKISTLKIRPWLRIIARNTALNQRKHDARHPTLSIELFEESGGQLIGDKFASAEELLTGIEIADEISTWLKELPPNDFLMLKLRLGLDGPGGYEYKYIAQELGMSEDAVRKRIQRVLMNIRKNLEGKFGPTVLSELMRQ
jgi:RNA polymerase sigma factor (sigma-70 family)